MSNNTPAWNIPVVVKGKLQDSDKSLSFHSLEVTSSKSILALTEVDITICKSKMILQ